MKPLAPRASEPHPARIRGSGRRFAVALSFPGELRGKASAIAGRLADALGQDRIFYDKFYEAELARPDLDLPLLEIYREQADLVVVFLSRDYVVKEWCGLEGRAVRDLIKSRQSERVMLLRFDNTQIDGLLSIDGYVHARARRPKELTGLILERLKDRPHDAVLAPQEVARPGLVRHLLDRALPRLHLWLTRIGTFPEPPEMADLHAFLGDLKAGIEQDVHEKTYLPLVARDMPRRTMPEVGGQDPFVRPVQQHIRQVLGIAEGGDLASAQIAAVNRRSRLITDILKTLFTTDDPLVLLGNPGSGKTLTLQQAVIALAGSELRRVFPRVALFVRLGELHVEGTVGTEEVFAYARKYAPARLQPWLDSLDRAGRLVLLFDGMDEMSRERYNEHTEALSEFAGSRYGRTRMLFSCRITDFSPSFIHRRLVLLPFNRAQIRAFLRRYLPGPSLTIDGSTWSIHRLVRHLSAEDPPVESSNPFVLWLLCLYLRERRSWPASRVDLMLTFNLENFERKRHVAEADGDPFPEPDEAFQEWARLAFAITERNQGAAIPVDALVEGFTDPAAAERVYRMIRVGKSCGVLAESIEGALYQVRFSHHRFQEYFAALHIRENNPPVDWLSRLDAPRWQETMVNLVLMGGAEDGVMILADSIAESVRRHRSADEKKKLPDAEEAILADRVELGVKLSKQGERSSLAVQTHLKPAMRDAVDFLVERGNPITQVKMMRACQHSTDLNLLKAIQKPLRSPVRWVRDQALILVSAGGPGSRSSGANLIAEMGLDLATSSFLFRWHAYLKAVLAAREKGKWWGFALATVCGLLGFLVFFAEAVLVYEFFGKSFAPEFLNGMGGLLIAGLVLGFYFIVRPDTSFLWSFSPLATFAAVTSVLVVRELLGGEWEEAVGVAVAGVAFGWAGIYAVALPVALVHFSLLRLFLALTRRARDDDKAGASILALAWTECGFQEIVRGYLTLLRNMGKIAVGLAGLLALVGIYFSVKVSPSLSLVVTLAALVLVCLLALRTARGRERTAAVWEWITTDGRRGAGEAISMLVAYTLVGTLVAALVGALMLPLKWTWDRVGWIWDRFIEQVLPFLSPWTARVLAVALTLLVVYFMVPPLSRKILRSFRAAFSTGIYRSKTFTQQGWIRRLQEAIPEEQADLLRRTNHQSLGLRPEELLEVLRDAGEHVKKEPAISVYWDRRDQLEQALRQERQG